jgi:antitoxin component of MazEF toxin-antitoxin module
VILPKAIREAVGIEEDEVHLELGDRIISRPVKSKINADKIREAFIRHVEASMRVEGRREPKPGEPAEVSPEEEFAKTFLDMPLQIYLNTVGGREARTLHEED